MGTTTKTVGGGPATGLADNFIQFLQNGLNTGTFGAGPINPQYSAAQGLANSENPFTAAVGRQMLSKVSPGGTGTTNLGIAGVLNDIFSAGGGKIGGSLADIIKQNDTDQVNALRARFGAGGGTAFGTGAQYAEGVLRSREAPQLTQAIGNLQLSALSPILSIIAGLSGKGIPQAETITEPSAFSQVVQGLGAIAPIVAAPFTGGLSLAATPALGDLTMQPHMTSMLPSLGVGSGTMPQLGSITIP